MTNKEAIEYGKQWDMAIESRGDTLFSDARQFLSLAIKALEEAKQGEWVVQRLQSGFDDVYCPFCNARPTRSEYGYYLRDNFCHECGAELKGGADND